MTEQELEQALIKEGQSICPNVLNKIKNVQVNQVEHKFTFKRLKVAFSFIIFICLLIVPYLLYNSVYETYTIDCNPSVELEINYFNKVLNINFNNEDAYNSYKELALKNKSLTVATSIIVDKLYQDGYLSDEQNLVIISCEAKGNKVNNQKLKDLSSKVEKQCHDKDVNCHVKDNVVTHKEQQIAKEHNISYGKLSLINEILAKTNEYTFDELAKKPMRELKDLYHLLNSGK